MKLYNVNILFPYVLQVEGNENYVNSGPPYLILLHPALGPIWEVIRQKVLEFLLAILL